MSFDADRLSISPLMGEPQFNRRGTDHRGLKP